MSLALRALVLRLASEIEGRKPELLAYLVRHILEPRVVAVVEMQLLARERVNGVDDNMRVNSLCIRMRGDDALTVFKHFLGASLGVLLNHKRVSVICSVGRELEVIILSLIAIVAFPEPYRRLFELRDVVLIDKQILHIDERRLILAGYVGDCLVRRRFARSPF